MGIFGIECAEMLRKKIMGQVKLAKVIRHNLDKSN